MSMSEKCQYCSVADGSHTESCPTKDSNPTWAIGEWTKGCNRGFNDEYISEYRLQYYSQPFRIGYRKGKMEIDRAVQDAADFQASGGYEY